MQWLPARILLCSAWRVHVSAMPGRLLCFLLEFIALHTVLCWHICFLQWLDIVHELFGRQCGLIIRCTVLPYVRCWLLQPQHWRLALHWLLYRHVPTEFWPDELHLLSTR